MCEYFTTKLRISLHRINDLTCVFHVSSRKVRVQGVKTQGTANLERCMDVFREMGRRSRETITGWSIRGWSDVPKYR